MSTTTYHTNGEKSMEILYHGLRVFPAIVDSLRESGVYILCVRWDAVDNLCEIHASGTPQIQAWALSRAANARLIEEGGDSYPWRVIYTVDDVNIFVLLTAEDKEKYFPD